MVAGDAVEPEFLEAGIDFDRANAARMYDYYLGGAHNFAVDRERAERVIAGQPHTRLMARANRSFLGRVVRWSLERGVNQFLDLGSGVPTVGNVHEIAREHDPNARVAYVDFEPVAVAHATEIINELDTTMVTVTRADARDPEGVLSAPGVAGLLDFDRPIALLMVSVLPFVHGDITALVGAYRAALAPGSLVALSHISDDQPDPAFVEQMRAMRQAYLDSATPIVLRDRAQLRDALDGLELLPPGLVDITEWPRTGPTATARKELKAWVYGAVGVVTAVEPRPGRPLT